MKINTWKFYWFKNTNIKRSKTFKNRLQKFFKNVTVNRLGCGDEYSFKIRARYLRVTSEPKTIIIDGIKYKEIQ